MITVLSLFRMVRHEETPANFEYSSADGRIAKTTWAESDPVLVKGSGYAVRWVPL